MLYVLYRNSGVYSGRALRKELEKLYSGEVRGGYPNRLEKIIKKGEEPEFIVNLGTTDELGCEGKTINSRDMVRSASNKRLARVAFQDAEVPAPQLFLKASEIKKEDLPVIGRTSYHRKGQGFWYCRNKREVEQALARGATHFLSFIPDTREYRVHTFIKRKYWEVAPEEREVDHYVSIKVSEKVWQGESKPNPLEPQKNHEFGWVFLGQQGRREEELNVVRFAAKQAIAALGMDFGAVDVMYRLRTKQPFVLEVNSTPSMSDEHANTCEVYAQRILKTIGADKSGDE